MFPHSDRPPRFPRGGAPPPRGIGGGAAPESEPPLRRRGPARSAGTRGTGYGSAPPSPRKCEPTDARCARPSRRTATGGAPLRPRFCLWERDCQSPPRHRPRTPMGPPRRGQPRSSTPWKRMIVRTRMPQQTRAEAPPNSGPRATTKRVPSTATLATRRETLRGWPPRWVFDGCFPPQDAPPLLHHGEPPTAVPQAPGRGGVPACGRLLPSRPRAAGGGQWSRTGGASAPPNSKVTGSRPACPAGAASRRVGTGPRPLRTPAVGLWGWHPSGHSGQRGTHRRQAPAAARRARPTRAHPFPARRRGRRGHRGPPGRPIRGRGGAAVHPAQLPHRGLVGLGQVVLHRVRRRRGQGGGPQPGPPKGPRP